VAWIAGGLVAALVLLAIPSPGDGWASPAAATDPPRPRVIDGDTIQTPEGVFNLAGIDAPELGQRCFRAGRWINCGSDAAFALHRALGLALAPVVCTPANRDGEPEAATCAIGDKQDLAIMLLSQGLALALPDASVRYKEAEESARAGSLGVWATDFVRPDTWRRGGRLPDDPVEDPPPCPIKALLTDEGQRIYQVPLDPEYEAIAADSVEALYCSDEAAEADGWRRPPLPVQP